MAKLMDKKDKDGYPFRYTDSRHTDIRKTFARARRDQLEALKPPQPLRVITERKKNGTF